VKVPGSELLTSGTEPNVATVEYQVAQKATGAILHEYSNSGCSLGPRSRHIKVEVLQRSGLRNLPVDSCWDILLSVVIVREVHLCQIKHKVSDLAIELVLVDIPFITAAFWDVDVRINERNTRKV
jgi:hypothetical protein